MTELQGVELLEMVADIRRMVELATWSVFIGTGFVIGNTLHRWTRGR